MVAPRDESSDLVMQWIESEGLRQYATLSPRQDSVIVEASISKIEKLLNAEYTPFGMPPYLLYMVHITYSGTLQPNHLQEMS